MPSLRRTDERSAGCGVMERLTEKHYLGTDHYMKCSGSCNVDMDCIDCPSFDRLVERLAAYEDTGLMPGDIKGLIELSVAKTNKALRLEEELRAMKNELCQYCGKYKHAQEGACDGCLWREK